jgi:hypothetical protein
MKWRQWLLIGVLVGLLVLVWATDRPSPKGPPSQFLVLLIWLPIVFSVTLPIIGIGYLAAYVIRRRSRKPNSN